MADFHLINCDSEEIYNNVLTQLEQSVGEPLYPGDERRYFGEAIALLFTQLYSAADDAGKQSMLQYARGEALDAIGARLGVKRLDGSPATCIIRFSVQEALPRDIVIPKYSKVKTAEDIYFATTESCTIKAGALAVECEAQSIGRGAKYNGFTEGSVNTPVNLISYVNKATNITVTSGGDDGEPYTTEGDDRLRERIRLAPFKLSVAGPRDAYIYWAETADPDIADVKAVSDVETIRRTIPVNHGKAYIGGSHLLEDTLKCDHDFTAEYADDLLTLTVSDDLQDLQVQYDRTLEGHVVIVPLMKDGKLPDEKTCQKILDTVNAQDIRPMTDYVEVKAPHIISYDIELKYYTTPETESDIVEAIEGDDGAIAAYNVWQQAAIGRDINPDALRQQILTKAWETGGLTGAIRIDVVKPEYTEVFDTEVPQFSGSLKVSHENITGAI